MKELQTDLSIFKKFDFERKPVGVKYLLMKPVGIEQLDKKLAICEMVKEAQDRRPFYASVDSFECMVGPMLLGMKEPDPIFESGQIGPKLGIVDDARANRRFYNQIPIIARNSVNYVVFSSLDDLNFEPDVLIITASPGQAEILLRAMSYSTGKMWHSKGTTVIGCAWLYVHPYVSGELNIMITGLHHGMNARHIFPDGLLLVSIPYDLISTIVDNLQRIEWVLPQYYKGKEAHVQNMRKIAQDLKQELQNE